MNKKAIIREAFQLNGPEQAAYFADDFQWTDSLGSPPMDKASWLGMGDLMQAAFPDLALVVEKIQEDGDDLVVTSRFTGTFRNDMDLSALGMGVVRATGKAAEFPSQRDRVILENGKISRMQNIETGPDAGMGGFFKALGVEPG